MARSLNPSPRHGSFILGLLRFEAQEAVLLALLALALYRGCHAHPTMVPHCSRTQDDIEPILRAQCFFTVEVHSSCLCHLFWSVLDTYYISEGKLHYFTSFKCMPLASIISTQQEEDILDAWLFFSSLFPFTSLVWPGQEREGSTPDLACFFLTTLVEMGHSILFFWLA
ncbi:valine--tRNA ligase-like [Scylla paramamosain]|uniref:valine--tRNA ligase-like n=1 Tax=Scylla paramamosain TaxID=85552 RepID=UPI00308285C9